MTTVLAVLLGGFVNSIRRLHDDILPMCNECALIEVTGAPRSGVKKPPRRAAAWRLSRGQDTGLTEHNAAATGRLNSGPQHCESALG